MLTSSRIVAVDDFRGATIALMILVNNPGSWGQVYAPLLHAEWHGCTPTDLVFPFFLFLVGVSIALALRKRIDADSAHGPIVRKVVRRSVLLFAIGVFLNAFPFVRDFLTWEWKDWSKLRIPGVLQRIAVCYLAVALLFLKCRRATMHVLTVLFLLGYWALMTLVQSPISRDRSTTGPATSRPTSTDSCSATTCGHRPGRGIPKDCSARSRRSPRR